MIEEVLRTRLRVTKILRATIKRMSYISWKNKLNFISRVKSWLNSVNQNTNDFRMKCRTFLGSSKYFSL